MADIETSVRNGLKIEGCLGLAIVDCEGRLCLGLAGDPGFDLKLAATRSAELVRASARLSGKLGIRDELEDILVTSGAQYHLIRMVGSGVFVYCVLDRDKSDLVLARKGLAAIDQSLVVARV